VSEAERRAHALRAKILRNRVGLDEARATKVEAILDRFAPERRKAAEDIRAAKNGLQQLLQSGSEDQKAYSRALDKLRAGNKALQAVSDKEVSAVNAELKPKEQALLLRSLDRMRRQAQTQAAATPARSRFGR